MIQQLREDRPGTIGDIQSGKAKPTAFRVKFSAELSNLRSIELGERVTGVYRLPDSRRT